MHIAFESPDQAEVHSLIAELDAYLYSLYPPENVYALDIASLLHPSVLFAVSEMETETRKERQADGIKAAKAKGVYKGRAKGSSTVDSIRVRELKAQGLKVTEIARALGISRQSVYSHLGE